MKKTKFGVLCVIMSLLMLCLCFTGCNKGSEKVIEEEWREAFSEQTLNNVTVNYKSKSDNSRIDYYRSGEKELTVQNGGGYSDYRTLIIYNANGGGLHQQYTYSGGDWTDVGLSENAHSYFWLEDFYFYADYYEYFIYSKKDGGYVLNKEADIPEDLDFLEYELIKFKNKRVSYIKNRWDIGTEDEDSEEYKFGSYGKTKVTVPARDDTIIILP